jgi:hypothetical protein
MWVYIHRFDSLSIYTLFFFFINNLNYTIKNTIYYVLKYNYFDIFRKNKDLWRRDSIEIILEIH